MIMLMTMLITSTIHNIQEVSCCHCQAGGQGAWFPTSGQHATVACGAHLHGRLVCRNNSPDSAFAEEAHKVCDCTQQRLVHLESPRQLWVPLQATQCTCTHMHPPYPLTHTHPVTLWRRPMSLRDCWQDDGVQNAISGCPFSALRCGACLPHSTGMYNTQALEDVVQLYTFLHVTVCILCTRQVAGAGAGTGGAAGHHIRRRHWVSPATQACTTISTATGCAGQGFSKACCSQKGSLRRGDV